MRDATIPSRIEDRIVYLGPRELAALRAHAQPYLLVSTMDG